ncbi:MAG: hypothetical protein IT291_03000 [Deltaproteobacteria bacterium]|nr:hypothetical protein [Deltaproteobacteria bacterium]
MKRSEVLAKCNDALKSARNVIEKSPGKSVVVAFVLGIVATMFKGGLLSLVFLGIIAFAVIWFISDEDSCESCETKSIEPQDAKKAAHTTEDKSSSSSKKSSRINGDASGGKKTTSEEKSKSTDAEKLA